METSTKPIERKKTASIEEICELWNKICRNENNTKIILRMGLNGLGMLNGSDEVI